MLSPEDESVVVCRKTDWGAGDDRGRCCSDDPEMRWESRGADAGGGSRQGEKRESRQTSWRTGQSSAQSGERDMKEDSRTY